MPVEIPLGSPLLLLTSTVGFVPIIFSWSRMHIKQIASRRLLRRKTLPAGITPFGLTVELLACPLVRADQSLSPVAVNKPTALIEPLVNQ